MPNVQAISNVAHSAPATALKGATVAASRPGRPHVTIRGLSKRFGSTVIYDKFDLDIPRGELTCVFGPNGCGKSTLINMVAGLIAPDAGEVLFDGMLLSQIKFGYVFQNYREALFPWLRAYDNIAYPLKLMSAPGPANLNTAKGILAKIGLKAGDYTIDQLDMGQHVAAMKGGTFDGGYTLEPSATIMQKLGVAKVLEAGVVAKYILGDSQADAWAAGCAFSSDFIKARPDVAKRFAAAWAKAIDYIRANPAAAQKYLAKNTMTPDDLVDVVPPLGYRMVKDFSPKQMEYLQTFADFGTEVGVVPEKVDVKKYIVTSF